MCDGAQACCPRMLTSWTGRGPVVNQVCFTPLGMFSILEDELAYCHCTNSRGPNELGRNRDVTENRNVPAVIRIHGLGRSNLSCRHNLFFGYLIISI